jgi:hypothetical protein
LVPSWSKDLITKGAISSISYPELRLPKVLVQDKLDSGALVALNISNEQAAMTRFTQLFWHHGFELSPFGKPLLAELKAALSSV